VRSSLEGQVNVFETEVRQQVALKDTAKLGRSILETEPDGASAAAYRSLAHEVLVALGEEEATPPPMVEVEEEVVEPAVVSAPPKGIALFVPSFETFVQEGWPQWLGSAASSSTPRLDGQRYRPNRLAQARAAVVEHRFEDAARQASHVLSDAAGCLMSLRILAWAQLELGDERAVASFERCVELDPEDARAEVGQAIWHQQREHEAAAVAHWLRAWELDPHNQLIRRALVRLTGDLPDSLLAEGIGLLRVGRWDEAAEVLRQVLAANPSDTAANLGLIAAWRALGARRQADELAIAVHTLAPSCIKGLLYVAAMQEAEGRKLRSRDLLARAEQADPGLVLFADVAHELFALPVPAETRASRPTLASAG
jgi:tetratricopeptide (TPR) repeat protein